MSLVCNVSDKKQCLHWWGVITFTQLTSGKGQLFLFIIVYCSSHGQETDLGLEQLLPPSFRGRPFPFPPKLTESTLVPQRKSLMGSDFQDSKRFLWTELLFLTGKNFPREKGWGWGLWPVEGGWRGRKHGRDGQKTVSLWSPCWGESFIAGQRNALRLTTAGASFTLPPPWDLTHHGQQQPHASHAWTEALSVWSGRPRGQAKTGLEGILSPGGLLVVILE